MDYVKVRFLNPFFSQILRILEIRTKPLRLLHYCKYFDGNLQAVKVTENRNVPYIT